MKVFLNPGHHPGVDPGAVNRRYGITEAEMVARIGKDVERYLVAAGVEVETLQSDNLTGESPQYPCIVKAANRSGADVFISIHLNAFNGEAKGTEVDVYRMGGDAQILAECVLSQLVLALGTRNRGIKVRKDLAVLKYTDMPAILVECLYIDNDREAVLLIDDGIREEIAKAIARGVTDYEQTLL